MWRDSNLQLFHRSSLRPSIDLWSWKTCQNILFISIWYHCHHTRLFPVYPSQRSSCLCLKTSLIWFWQAYRGYLGRFSLRSSYNLSYPRLSFVIATFSFICCFIIFSIVSFFGYSKRRIEYPKSANYLNISSEKYIQNIFLNLVMPKHSSQSQNKIQPKNSFGGWAFAKLRTGK